MVADAVAARVTALSVRCSLAYLDVAVVRALWDELGLAVPLHARQQSIVGCERLRPRSRFYRRQGA